MPVGRDAQPEPSNVIQHGIYSATSKRRLRSNLPYLGKSSRRAAILQKSSAKNADNQAETDVTLRSSVRRYSFALSTFGKGRVP